MTAHLSEFFEGDGRLGWMEFCFDTIRPPLAFFPHCIFRRCKESFVAVLRGCNSLGGVFCKRMPWDAGGKPFEGTTEQAMEQFALWEAPKNQGWVHDNGCFAELSQFTAAIDTRTSREVLLDMFRVASIGEFNVSCYVWWINNFQRWLPQLKWAFLPLADDSPWGMFVSSERKLCDDVISEFDRNAIRWFSMEVEGDVVSWPDDSDELL